MDRDWWNIIIQYGSSAGRVNRSWDNNIHFHVSKEHGCYVSVPQKEFDLLIRTSFIDGRGKVLEGT